VNQLIQKGGRVVGLAVVLTLAGCHRAPPMPEAAPIAIDPIEGEEAAVSASAPKVPPPIARTYATKVLLDIEVREHVASLAEGVQYLYWTYGDEAPGKFYRVREGDLVEVRLHNHPSNSLAHNIDFQAATGPGGGGDASFVAPGYSAVFAWRARRPGLFLYQCSAAPAGVQVANGMYGLILVEPKGGLPKVDREYQIVQSEFYTEGKFGERGDQRFSADKAGRAEPEYVVFNGHLGALTGTNALAASTGERVRLFVGNAGPNLPSSFHVAGETFENVYSEGGAVPNRHDVQTTEVPAGGATIVEFGLEVPGEYPVLDHSLFRAAAKGAMGLLSVAGKDNHLVFSGTTSQSVYEPDTELAKTLGFGRLETTDGSKIFGTVCATCHQASGQGIPKAFPPLRESDFLVADPKRAIRIVMSGLKGPIMVNGNPFDAVMPNPGLNDEQIASVLTFESTNLGNKGRPITVEEVAQVRKSWDGAALLQADPLWAKPAPRLLTRASYGKAPR
jgi:nitrite reductase (NO-forming)